MEREPAAASIIDPGRQPADRLRLHRARWRESRGSGGGSSSAGSRPPVAAEHPIRQALTAVHWQPLRVSEAGAAVRRRGLHLRGVLWRWTSTSRRALQLSLFSEPLLEHLLRDVIVVLFVGRGRRRVMAAASRLGRGRRLRRRIPMCCRSTRTAARTECGAEGMRRGRDVIRRIPCRSAAEQEAEDIFPVYQKSKHQKNEHMTTTSFFPVRHENKHMRIRA